MRQNTKLRTIGCALLVARMIAAGPLLAQESAPLAPEVEKQPDAARDTRPIAADKKPNVVFILADNVGYGGLGPHGGGELRGAPTPRIDQLDSLKAKGATDIGPLPLRFLPVAN